MESIKKIIKLIQRTGDRFIVLDTNEENAYVVMSLKDYEKVLDVPQEVKDLSEPELLEKINKEIALWRSQQESREVEQKNVWKKEVVQEPLFTKTETVETPKIEPKVEEIAVTQEEKAEGEEDKYYFEPVES